MGAGRALVSSKATKPAKDRAELASAFNSWGAGETAQCYTGGGVLSTWRFLLSPHRAPSSLPPPPTAAYWKEGQAQPGELIIRAGRR